MAEPTQMATEFHPLDGVVTLLLKIWSNKEAEEIDLPDVFHLPDYKELAKSSSTLFDLVGRYVLEAVFGPGFSAEQRSAAWLLGLSSSFVSGMRTADTKTKTVTLKAIEILSTSPLAEGTACKPLPDGPAGRWCFQEGGVRLLYDVDEQSKRVHLLSLTQ